MTTAHRPTFDQARAKGGKRSTIQHKRGLPSQTRLKFRKKTRINEDFDEKEWDVDKDDVEEMKKRLTGEEGAMGPVEESKGPTAAGKSEEAEEAEEEAGEKAVRAEVEVVKDGEEPVSVSESNEGSDSGSDSGSNSDSDLDEELLKELAKVRQERKERQEKQEQEAKQERAKESNPLMKEGTSRSWRSTVFHHKHHKPQKDRVMNDMVRSDFHHRFMDRYFK